MALSPSPSLLISRGAIGVFRGLRLGNQRALYLGAMMLAVGLLRRAGGPQRRLLRREVLRPGRSLVIRERGGAEPPLVITAD